MSSNSLNDEEVAVDDEKQWHKVNEDTINEDIRSGEHILSQIVGTAGGHVAFGDIAVKDKYHICLNVYYEFISYNLEQN
jgi:hypothetical protein